MPNEKNVAIGALGVVAVVVVLKEGWLSSLRDHIRAAVKPGTLPTTPDTQALLGAAGAQTQAQVLQTTSQQAQGGTAALQGDLSNILHGDLFTPLHAGIGGDTAQVTGPYNVLPQLGGTLADGKFTLSGAVIWIQNGASHLAYDASIAGKSFAVPAGTVGQPSVPQSFATPVVTGINALTPSQAASYQGF